MAALDNVPGLAGYLQRRGQIQGDETRDLQQAAGLMGLLSQVQQQQRLQQKDARTAEYRAGIRPDMTGPELLAHSKRFIDDPKDLATLIQSEDLKKTQMANTNEIAISRLAQQANHHIQDLAVRQQNAATAARNATTAEGRAQAELEANHWKQQIDTYKLDVSRRASDIQAGRATYDTGMAFPQLRPFTPTPASSPAGTTAPQSQTITAPGLSPGNLSAIDAIRSAGGGSVTLDEPYQAGPSVGLAGVLAQAGARPAPSYAPTSSAPSESATRSFPQFSGYVPPGVNPALDNQDTEMRRFGSGGPSTPAPQAAATSPSPTSPQMPKFSGSPRDVARAQNEWRIDQAKAAAAQARDRAREGAKIGVNLAGGRESVFINRVVQAGNQAAADLDNVVKLPMSASRGFFGGRGQGKGLLDAGKETLANTMTTQEVQTYNVMATGFQRALAAIEGAGLAPSNALMHMMDAVIFKEGDTNFTKLAKLAQTRQIVEKGLETIAVNPRVDEGTKKHINEIVAKVRAAVPFTGADLIRMQQVQQTNPNATLAEVMSSMQPATGWTDDKERRYQELLKKRGGS